MSPPWAQRSPPGEAARLSPIRSARHPTECHRSSGCQPSQYLSAADAPLFKLLQDCFEGRIDIEGAFLLLFGRFLALELTDFRLLATRGSFFGLPIFPFWVGLFDRQTNPTAFFVHLGDFDRNRLAYGQLQFRRLHPMDGDLRHMDQSLDSVSNRNKRTKRHCLGNRTFHDVADPVFSGELDPRILLGLFDREGDALTIQVDLKALRPVEDPYAP